jgi:hypothetical protein
MLEYVQSTVQGATGFQDISLDRLAQIAASMGGKDRLKHQVAFSFQDARNRLPVIGSLGLEQICVSRPDLENDLEFWVRNTPSGLVASSTTGLTSRRMRSWRVCVTTCCGCWSGSWKARQHRSRES